MTAVAESSILSFFDSMTDRDVKLGFFPATEARLFKTEY